MRLTLDELSCLVERCREIEPTLPPDQPRQRLAMATLDLADRVDEVHAECIAQRTVIAKLRAVADAAGELALLHSLVEGSPPYPTAAMWLRALDKLNAALDEAKRHG